MLRRLTPARVLLPRRARAPHAPGTDTAADSKNRLRLQPKRPGQLAPVVHTDDLRAPDAPSRGEHLPQTERPGASPGSAREPDSHPGHHRVQVPHGPAPGEDAAGQREVGGVRGGSSGEKGERGGGRRGRRRARHRRRAQPDPEGVIQAAG